MRKRNIYLLELSLTALLVGLCFSGCQAGTFLPMEQGGAVGRQAETVQDTGEQETQAAEGQQDADSEKNGTGFATETGQMSSETADSETSDASEGEAVIRPLRKEPEPLTVLFSSEWLSKWDKEQTKYLLETTFNLPKLSAYDGKDYPELQIALAQYARSEKKRMKKLFQSTAKDVEEIGTGVQEWSIRNWMSVARADSRVVSLMTRYSDYLGGAHGMFYTDGINFDSETGKKLSLKDIFVSTDKLPGILENKLLKKYGRNAFFNAEQEGTSIFAPIIEAREENAGTEADVGKGTDAGTEATAGTETDVEDSGTVTLREEEYTWCVTNDGVVFYFAPYLLGPYASGEFECLIPFRQKNLFQPVYTETAKKYVRELAWDFEDELGGSLSCQADLDGDGMQEKLFIDRTACDEYGSDFNVKITYKGKKWSNQIHGFSFSPVLLHLEDGRNYLYLGVTMENDYPEMYVFSLSKKGVKKVGSKNLGFHGEEDGEEQYFTSMPANPDEFKLDTRLDTLSTYTGWKKYHVGKNGMPVADMTYYRTESSITMTSIRSMKLAIVNEKGKKIKTKKIPKGTKFRFYRTDAKKYVDMKLPDGKICRLHIGGKGGDWSESQKVEGKPLDQTFEGFMFAG